MVSASWHARNRQAVRLYTRNGYDFGDRFPKIIEAIKSLPVHSCFVVGEVIVVDERGLSVFDHLRSGRRDRDAVLCAFDLIELDGRDLRGAPIEEPKNVLANLLFREGDAISFQ